MLMKSRSALFVFLALIVAVSFVGLRVQQWLKDPQVFLLVNTDDAKWVRHFMPFKVSLDSYFEPIKTTFRREFDLSEPVANAHLVVQAFRQCEVWLDSAPDATAPIFASSNDLNIWKKPHDILLPAQLSPGRHQLWIQVTNRGAQPCLLAFSRELHLATDQTWETSLHRKNWKPAVRADDSTPEMTTRIELVGYPSVYKSFLTLSPWLAIVFGFTFAVVMWESNPGESQPSMTWTRMTPQRLRWILLIAWVFMALNNVLRVNSDWGFDSESHLAYVKFIVEKHQIPLATDGWQLFQSPLLYLLAAPFYALSSIEFGPELAAKIIRFLPLLSGLAQIEIAYRSARTVFPEKGDQQIVATLVGGLMPMNIYMSQSFANEPLAGCFTSLTILFCISLLANRDLGARLQFFLLLGAVWGLALLSKVTPVLLAPMIFAVIVCQTWKLTGSLIAILVRLGCTSFACLLVAGWYYLRNWILLGRPFIGGWDPGIGILWWQDPSYRTWSQLTSFGLALRQPVYSGVLSLWDAIYSSMWTDGFLSGKVGTTDKIPWNIQWMEVGAWLSILPMACILIGPFRIIGNGMGSTRSSLLFAIGAIGIYLAALVDLYVHVPIYSQAKATYMLGLLPCFAILAAAGAAPLLRIRGVRAAFFAGIATWSIATYAAYFCLR